MDELISMGSKNQLALDSEYNLAGCLLVDTLQAVEIIRNTVFVDDFQDKRCRAIYTATLEMVSNGEKCDPGLIQHKVEEMGVQIEAEFCREIRLNYTTTANALEHAKIVSEAAQKRRAASVAMDLVGDRITILEALARLQSIMNAEKQTLPTAMELINEYTDYLFSDDPEEPCLSTGYSKLDEILSGGIMKGGLYTLAARSGIGKTTAALNLSDNIMAMGKTVIYISLEMPKKQILGRRTAIASGMGGAEIAGKRFRGNELKERNVMATMNKLSKRDFRFFYGSAGMRDIERIIRSTEHPDLVVIDHIGLIEDVTRSDGRSTYEAMTRVTHRLKQIALSTDIPILALSQLNRAVESREDKWPRLSDLRDSGSIEEDSDVVILLFREAYYLQDELKPKPEEPQEIDFIVAKNRHGTTGTITLTYTEYNSQIKERTRRGKCA